MPPLQRRQALNGVILLESALLRNRGVPHAFTTRIGGVSAAPFDTLNLAGPLSAGGSDVEAHRRRNHALILEAIGCPAHAWAGLHLVHGVDVHVCHRDWPVSGDVPQGDAVVSALPGRILKVTTADCVGVILATENGRTVGAVHAGWRGVVGGVLTKAVSTLRQVAGRIDAPVLAAIGPAISLEAFEVGEEVAKSFQDAGLHAHIHRTAQWPRPHADLHGALRSQLRACGIPADSIDGEPMCTVGSPELFFSHRRDAGRTGRMAAIVAPAA